jgi:hypothetical protein
MRCTLALVLILFPVVIFILLLLMMCVMLLGEPVVCVLVVVLGMMGRVVAVEGVPREVHLDVLGVNAGGPCH